MPVTTPQQKIDKTRIFGGEFITIKLFGDFFDQCYQAARDHVESIDGVMVPPFDHADIIEGRRRSLPRSPSSCLMALSPTMCFSPLAAAVLQPGSPAILPISSRATPLPLPSPPALEPASQHRS